MMKNATRLGAALALLGMASCHRAPQPADIAAAARLDGAQAAQEAADAARPALARSVLFWADFEHDGLALLGDGRLLPLPLAEGHVRPGRNGRGFHFEKPRANQLPPGLADVEDGADGFLAENGATAAATAAGTPFGSQALRIALPGSNAVVRTRPCAVAWKTRSWHEKQWSLLASCYVKGPRGARLTAEVRFAPADLALKPGDPPRIEDTAEPQTVELTGEWQRVACWASADTRLRERLAVFALRADAPLPELLADGFQWEQGLCYPHNHRMPTTWLPGGASAPATSVRIGSPLREVFPVESGAIAFWVRTPLESNLPQPGASAWLSFGAGWGPGWRINPGQCDAPGARVNFGRALAAPAGAGDGRHIAMSWGPTNLAVYVDGELAGSAARAPLEQPLSIETSNLVLGGSYSSGQTANAILDEVAIFSRPLTAEEARTLATGPALPVATGTIRFTAGDRAVTYRDETNAVWQASILSTASTNRTLTVDLEIGGALTASRTLDVPPGLSRVRFPFAPSRLACGDYTVRVGAAEAGAYAESPLAVVPALRRDHYMLSSWGSGGDTAAWRAFCRTLGLNTIDTYGANIEQLGREGFFYNWHYNFGDGVASPGNREAVREQTRLEAGKRASFPNWRSTLLNSEVGVGRLPPDEERAAWFDAWARTETGFAVPTNGWRFGTPHNPVSAWFTEADTPAASNGVYRACRAVDFMRWWYNRGAGWWRLNAEAAAVIAEQRPDVICWTDPLRYPGQIADLGGGSTWSYQLRPEPLIGDFESSYASARGTGKEYYATLGMNYVNPLTSKVVLPDGSTNTLAPTADDLIQQAWVVATHIPTDGLTYWSMNTLFNGLQRRNGCYAEPGSDERLGNLLKNEVLPVGTLLKQVPNAQRSVALLLPGSTLWLCAGEGKWGWGTAHYPNAWKNWVGGMGLPYDVLGDHEVTPGALSRYRAVIFPMAEYVSEKVYREVMAAAAAGTEIIVDSYCRQSYPGMARLGQAYYHRLRDRSGYAAMVAETKAYLAGLKERLLPRLDASAAGAAGPVLFNIREADGARYVSVINDHRREGPYSDWTTNTFKPYGVAQRADIFLRLPEGAAVYELTTSARLPLRRDGERQVASVDLPPHAGRLLCVYPAAVGQVAITAEASYAAGTAGSFRVTVLDERRRPLAGRQILHVDIRDPQGRAHDESGLYRAGNGVATIPFRPALNDVPGRWRVTVSEQASGVTGGARLRVAAP